MGDYKGKGYGKSLIESCLADAKEKGKSGVCMLGAKKQKAWLSDQSLAKRFGFHGSSFEKNIAKVDIVVQIKYSLSDVKARRWHDDRKRTATI